MLSLPMLDRFEEETGQAIDLRKCGYLFLLTRDEEIRKFRANVDLQNHLGIGTQWLSGDDVRRMVPQFAAEDVLAGTYYGEDGLVDPHSVVNGYINAGRRLGVTALSEIEVIGIAVERGRIAGVETNQGTITCEVLVNAAGPWSSLISDMVGLPLPVIPVKRQMLTTSPLPGIGEDFPFVIDFAQSLYFHREGEGLLTGMSNPNQEPGFNETVDDEWELVHMRAAIERLPLLGSASRVSGWAGLYEVTPDAHPIIGSIPDLEGYYVITGFSGHGFMHGPAAGLLLSEIIIDGRSTTLDISTLEFSRFVKGKEIEEYNVI